ncbi:MAG TPA: hypothetical protein PK167_13855, partial [Prolixibacteraceae bacterium]|nr:hypothetical protein [Prolixibacteraceae bacterium]
HKIWRERLHPPEVLCNISALKSPKAALSYPGNRFRAPRAIPFIVLRDASASTNRLTGNL